MTSAAAEDKAIIDDLKSACCCPDCGAYPCPPGSWYDESNPYRHSPKIKVQLGSVNRYFDNMRTARAALTAYNGKSTNRLRA